MKRRVISFLTAAAMLAGLLTALPAASGTEETAEALPMENAEPERPREEEMSPSAAEGDPFPALEFDEWEPAVNAGHPGGLAPNPFWRANVDRAEPSDRAYFSAVLPEKYDLRALGLSTAIRNQYSWGTCWAFGSLASLESNILTRSGVGGGAAKADPDYSEHQLAWFAYQQQTAATLAGSEAGQGQVGEGRASDSSPFNRGGNVTTVTSVLATWQGAASEADIPYTNSTGGTGTFGNWRLPDADRNKSAVHLTDVDFLPSPITYSAYGSNSLPTATATYRYDKAAEESVKRAIMDHGAVTIAYYADQSKPSGSKDGTYFNDANNCQYVNVLDASTIPNHAVCVVGWDDSYPRTNFNSGIRPEGDGAWIVKNSWGASHYDNGYFYLSYYDRTIRDIASLQGEEAFSYDHNYQYDYLQLGSYLGCSRTQSRAGLANVFTANGQETLKAVSLVTDTAGSDVTLEVYRLKAGAEGPYDGTLCSTQWATLTYAGYHTLELDTPVSLSGGERFSVVAEIHGPDGYYYLPLEVGSKAQGYIAVANPGESYRVYPSGKQYKDVSEEQYSSYEIGNAMIKAFTVDTDPNFPRVTAQPIDQEGRLGASVTFSIAVEGEGLSYQWQLSTDRGLTWTDVPGAVSASCTSPSLTMEMEGYRYRCKVSSPFGPLYSNAAAIISVLPASVTEISTLAELESFRDNVNAGAQYTTVRLTADIDLSGKYGPGKQEWTPIGNSSARAFPATAAFDGGGHTISGVYISTGGTGGTGALDRCCGLFGVNRGTIQNLGVSGSLRENTYSTIGGVCAYNLGSVINCSFRGTVTATSDYSDAGGICGNNGYNSSIINCQNDGTITLEASSPPGDLGGICGDNDGVISGCRNNGKIEDKTEDSGSAGGICGTNGSKPVTDCRNTGDVTAGYTGGICGKTEGSIQDCYNEGTITGKKDTGGIFGEIGSTSKIIEFQNCQNTGTVISENDAGGIAGNSRCGKLVNCYNEGAVTGIYNVGGICGEISYSAPACEIEDCYNTGMISSSGTYGYAGGILGRLSTYVVIKKCYNVGKIVSASASGGIYGERSSTSTVSNQVEHCYYLPIEAEQGSTQTPNEEGRVEAKTAEQFASGEVAYLLQSAKGSASAAQVWGQSVKGIGLDAAPVLTSDPEKAVYKVSFIQGGSTHAVKYANPAGVSGLPTAPVSGTTKLTRWSLTPDVNGEEFTADTPVSSDISVYAIGETMYGEAQGEKAVDLTYGAAKATRVDLSRYVAMGDGSGAQGKFKFTITDGGVDGVQITDMEILEIAADIPANEAGYPITIRAFRLSSDPVLMSAGTSLGTESFLFTVTVVVHKAEGSGSVSLEGWVYGEAPKTPVPVSSTNGVEHVTYLYKEKDAGDETYSETVPTLPGDYTVLARFAETGNYKQAQATAGFTIAQASSSVEGAPQARTLFYTGQPQELVTAGAASGGELRYSLDGESYSAAIPTATEVGSYTVFYILVGDEGHSGASGGKVVVQIRRATPTYALPEGLRATEGDLLASVALPSGWRWADEAQAVGGAGTAVFDAVYTPEDTVHYQPVTVSLSVTVTEAAATVYTVTFDTQISPVKTSVSVAGGSRLTRPADPVRVGFTFGGWYREPACAVAWDFANDIVTGSVTLYARWTENSHASDVGSSGGYTPPSYSSTVVQPKEGGVLSVTPSRPREGDTVTIRLKLERGYALATLTVTDRSGKAVEVTPSPDGSYTFVQPAGKVTVAAVCKPAEAAQTPAETAWVNPFADVDRDAWYYDAVEYAVREGLFTGATATAFCPQDAMTRAMLVTVLYRAAGKPAMPEANWGYPYADVDAGFYYAEAVYWARLNGIANGYDGESFGPNAPTVREQFAAMLWRYAGKPASTQALNFADGDSASGYAREALSWAVEQGILQGRGNGVLDPTGQITRAEVAVMLMRFRQLSK